MVKYISIYILAGNHFLGFFEVDGLLIRRLPFDGVEKKCNLGSYLSCNTFILKEILVNIF